MGKSPSPKPKQPLTTVAVKLLAQRSLHHVGAAMAAAVPYLVAATTGTPWPVAVATSTVVFVAWLLGNAHLQGKVATAIGTDLVQGLHELLSGDGLAAMLGGFLGGGGGITGPAPSGPMAAPPGMEGLFPSGQPFSSANDDYATAQGQTVTEAEQATVTKTHTRQAHK